MFQQLKLIKKVNKYFKSNCLVSNQLAFNSSSDSNVSGQNSSKPTKKESSQSSPINESKNISFPAYPDPNLCCQQGCEKCVWVEYADELEKVIKDSDMVLSEIERQIEDPFIRQFVIMQIKISKKK